MALPFLTCPPLGGCGDPGDPIDYACLFDGYGYLEHTFVADGDRTTAAVSFWLKMINGGIVFGQDRNPSSDANFAQVYLTPTVYQFTHDDGAVVAARLETAYGLRDYAAWAHFLIVMDTSNAAPSERVRIYKDGVRITDFDVTVDPAQGKLLDLFAGGIPFGIGDRNYGGIGVRLQAYLAEFIAVNGIAAGPGDFGYFNAQGVWVPKKYTGPCGTHGFHLDFADPLDLGKDVSGNGNHFTSTGLTADNQVTDTPTRNGGTWNPLTPDLNSTATSFSEGNRLYVVPGSNPGYGTHATLPLTGEVSYWQASVLGTNASNAHVGMCRLGAPAFDKVYGAVGGIVLRADGYLRRDGALTYMGAAWAYGAGNRLTFKYDRAAATLEVWKDDTYLGVLADMIEDSGDWAPSNGGSTNDAQDYNVRLHVAPEQFNAHAAIPADYQSGTVLELPCPIILNPDDYFTIRLTTGGAGVSDLPWDPTQHKTLVVSKRRDTAADWRVVDTVNGAGMAWATNDATSGIIAEADGLTAFTADGFTVGANTAYQGSRMDYIWRASRRAGFDIVGLINHTNGAETTVPHAVGGVIDYAWVVRADAGQSRRIFHHGLGGGSYFAMETNGAAVADAGWFSSSAGDLTLGASLPSGDYMIYAWRAVPQFSAFPDYQANNSADGVFIPSDFTPRLFQTSYGGTRSCFWDEGVVNGGNDELLDLDTAAAVAAGAEYCDFVSNGVKARSAYTPINYGSTHYYAAMWARTPFKFARAR